MSKCDKLWNYIKEKNMEKYVIIDSTIKVCCN